MLLKTINGNVSLDRNQEISNSSSKIRLIRRTSRSKSLKFDRSLSQSSLEKSFPAFFIKKVLKFQSKNNEEDVQTADVTPVKVLQRKNELENTTQKKRMPTPSKGYRQITDSSKTSKKLFTNNVNLEKEMEIHDLQKKLASQIKIRMFFEQKSKQFQNESAIQAKRVKNIEKQLQQLKTKEFKYQQKIKQLESFLQTKNADLKSTKSNLQKLKQNIKEVRTQEFHNEIKKLKEQLQKLNYTSEQQTNQWNSLKNQNTDLKMQIQRIKSLSQHNKLKAMQQSRASVLKKQIEHLKCQINIEKSDKQHFLQQKLHDSQDQIEKLKNIVLSKTIQIDFLQRKKHEEIELVKKRKGHQIRSLRTKYSVLMDEYKDLQHNRRSPRQKQNRHKSTQKRSVQKRQNRFVSLNRDHEDEFVSFSLSPDCR